MSAGSLRVATRKDITALSVLIDSSVRTFGAGYYDSAEIESSLRYLFGVDTQLIEDGTYYLIERASQLIACGGWSWRRTPFGGDNVSGVRDADTRVPGQDPAVIRAFFVHPAWGRRGLGKRVLEACEDAAREAGYDRFELTATPMGQPLYAACGYRDVEETVITLPDGTLLSNTRMSKP